MSCLFTAKTFMIFEENKDCGARGTLAACPIVSCCVQIEFEGTPFLGPRRITPVPGPSVYRFEIPTSVSRSYCDCVSYIVLRQMILKLLENGDSRLLLNLHNGYFIGVLLVLQCQCCVKSKVSDKRVKRVTSLRFHCGCAFLYNAKCFTIVSSPSLSCYACSLFGVRVFLIRHLGC